MQSLFQITQHIKLPEVKDCPFKNRRDELLKTHLPIINAIRAKAGYKPEKLDSLARRINSNPFLAGKNKDDELQLVLETCKQKNNYSHLYFLLKQK